VYHEISPYSYGLNNPIRYSDEEGLSPTERRWNSETQQYEFWATEDVVYANSPMTLPSLWAIEFMAHRSGNYKTNITSNPYWEENASGRVEESPGLEMLVGVGAGAKMAISGILGSVAKINGFTKHGINQVITRGFKTPNILKIVKEGDVVQGIGRYGIQTRYTLGENTVVLNAEGKVVTVFSKQQGTVKGLDEGFFVPLK
jgi:hypothetical protein